MGTDTTTDAERRSEFIRQLGKGREMAFATAVARCTAEEAQGWAAEVGYPDETLVRRAAADIERDRELARFIPRAQTAPAAVRSAGYAAEQAVEVRPRIQTVDAVAAVPAQRQRGWPEAARARAAEAHAEYVARLAATGVSTARIKQWARERGLDVGEPRARIPAGVLAAYEAAHPSGAEGESGCHVLQVDGDPVRVQGSAEMSPTAREAIADVIRAARNRLGSEPTPGESAAVLARHVLLVLDSVGRRFESTPEAGSGGLCLCGDPVAEHWDGLQCAQRQCGCQQARTLAFPGGVVSKAPLPIDRICPRCGLIVSGDYIARTGMTRHRSCHSSSTSPANA